MYQQRIQKEVRPIPLNATTTPPTAPAPPPVVEPKPQVASRPTWDHVIAEFRERMPVVDPQWTGYNLRPHMDRRDKFTKEHFVTYHTENLDLPEPTSMKEAKERPDWNEWLAAILLELDSHK